MIIEKEDKEHLPNSKWRMIHRKDGLQAGVDIEITVIFNICADHNLDGKL